MPMVGDKKFPYTAKGKKAAKMYAKAEKMEGKAMSMKMAKKKAAPKKKAAMKKMGKKK
jgi:hypothetical protein